MTFDELATLIIEWNAARRQRPGGGSVCRYDHAKQQLIAAAEAIALERETLAYDTAAAARTSKP